MDIGNKYKLRSNSMNVIISEKYTNKNKVESWRDVGYFATVQGALEFLVEHHVKKSGLKDLNEVCKQISEVKDMLQKPTTNTTTHAGASKGATR